MAELQKRNYKRERLVCKLYSKGKTYKEIGEELHITKARVGQIYRRILKDRLLNRVA